MTVRLLRVEADGGSRGNPGPAAFGAVVKDPNTNALLAEAAGELGITTNNVAEYQGLIAGLRLAHGIDPTARVAVAMDSKLVVEQMSGRWKIKHAPLRELAAEAGSIFPDGQVTYSWIPRERNRDADRLVNAALDGTWQGPGEAKPQAPQNHLMGWSAPVASATTTLLLRHGETEHTVEKRFSGSGGDDPTLSEWGEQQARLAAAFVQEHDNVVAVLTSPLRRTQQTAQEVAQVLGCDVVVDSDLRECNFGDWDGYAFTAVQERWPDELRAWLNSTAVRPPGGESFDEVAARVAQARARIVEQYPDAAVVVVTHVTPIKTLVRLALDAPSRALFSMELRPASLSSVVWYGDGNASLRAFNDTSFLRDEPSPHTVSRG